MTIQDFLDKFRLHNDKEAYPDVIRAITSGVVFRGTNLWVLIFAIFVASLGLNVNSTAVIIGAMLISPLMGPIMGIGLGLGINDISLFKVAFHNYLVATAVALATSTIFFVISPLSDAHSEILARTSPNIYDVLIALFGGLAGILATSSKHKGNVIPGVAIATALMPPLCTAGYGLATGQFNFFFGAFYLFLINTVFIALATFIMVRFLHFPLKVQSSPLSEKRAKRWVWLIVLITLIPSLYFGYDIVQQNNFNRNASQFIAEEAHFPNDYLLSKKIDPKAKSITLVFGGKEISPDEINSLKKKMGAYGLENTHLDIKQGFAYLANDLGKTKGDEFNQLSANLDLKNKQLQLAEQQLDSIKNLQNLSLQVYAEIKAQYPQVNNAIISPATSLRDSAHSTGTYLVYLSTGVKLPKAEKTRLEEWLKIRLKQNNITLITQP